jgi:hypothetical protein
VRRATSLWCIAAAACLLTAVPASASHHPPNSVTGLVTMAATRQGVQLILNYNVTQQACPNPSCQVNYGKPYRIDIFVDDPDGSSGVGYPLPRLISAPSEWCIKTGFEPLVDCNAPDRDQADPDAALPLSGTIKVHVGTVAGATAEIVVAGYSLNTYQDGIPVPEHDCGPLDLNMRHAENALIHTEQDEFFPAQKDYKAKLHEFIRLENAAFVWFLVGKYYVVYRSHALDLLHDAEGKLNSQATKLAMKRQELKEAREKLADCLGEPVAKKSLLANEAHAASCTDEQWLALIKRAQAIKIKNTAPLVRKILRELKAKKRAKAARHKKRLRALLKPELKALKALEKAVASCE